MESPSKERLTGALILVAALVILVPEMLSGPERAPAPPDPVAVAEAGPPLQTFDLVLDPAGAPGEAQQESLAPRTAAVEAPAPASEAPAVIEAPAAAEVAAAAPPPVVTVTPPAAAPAPKLAPAATPPPQPVASAPLPAAARPAAAGQWWAQLGSFSSRDNADRLSRQLRAAGFQIEVSQIRSGGKELFRVRAGPVRDRAAAVNLQSRLSAAGHKSSLVAP